MSQPLPWISPFATRPLHRFAQVIRCASSPFRFRQRRLKKPFSLPPGLPKSPLISPAPKLCMGYSAQRLHGNSPPPARCLSSRCLPGPESSALAPFAANFAASTVHRSTPRASWPPPAPISLSLHTPLLCRSALLSRCSSQRAEAACPGFQGLLRASRLPLPTSSKDSAPVDTMSRLRPAPGSHMASQGRVAQIALACSPVLPRPSSGRRRCRPPARYSQCCLCCSQALPPSFVPIPPRSLPTAQALP